MKRTRIGRALAYVGLAASASLMTVSPAKAYGDPQLFYRYYYYSDASHTTQVGYASQKCTFFGIQWDGPTQGQSTNYYDEEPIAYCGDGGYEYPL